MFYFQLFFSLLLPLSLSLSQVSEDDLFSPVTTLDGVLVNYVGVSHGEMSGSGKSVAYALYRDDSAQIIYDLDLFERIDDYSKFLILEHERAHHYLGHSLASKTYEELNQPL